MNIKQLDFILNDALNKALISKDRIKQPNTNKVADFVNKYIENKNQALQLNIAVVSGSFYWVRPYHGEEFEPAKCKDRYGNGKLWFCFTNGSVMKVERALEVEPLNYR